MDEDDVAVNVTPDDLGFSDLPDSLREQIEELDEAEIVQVIQRPGCVVDTSFDGMDPDRALLLLFKASVRMVIDEIFGMEDDDWDASAPPDEDDE